MVSKEVNMKRSQILFLIINGAFIGGFIGGIFGFLLLMLNGLRTTVSPWERAIENWFTSVAHPHDHEGIAVGISLVVLFLLGCTLFGGALGASYYVYKEERLTRE